MGSGNLRLCQLLAQLGQRPCHDMVVDVVAGMVGLGEQLGRLPEDLDLLLEPLDLALEPLRLGLLGLAGGQGLRRARRQVLVAPRAQLAGAQPQLGRHPRQSLAALEQPLDRSRLELRREPASGPPFRHPALLGCSGSLANPPLPRGKSKPPFAKS